MKSSLAAPSANANARPPLPLLQVALRLAAVFAYTPENVARLCGRRLIARCESYLEIGEALAGSHQRALARQRQRRRGEAEAEGHDSDSAGRAAVELDALLGPSQLQHLAAYDEIGARQAAAAQPHGITDFADLAQSPYHQMPCRGGVAPALLRGSHLFSLSRRRLLLPCELMAIQGISAGSGAAEDHPFDEEKAAEWRTPAAVRQMAGNSMHLCQVGTVIALVLAMTAELTRLAEPQLGVGGELPGSSSGLPAAAASSSPGSGSAGPAAVSAARRAEAAAEAEAEAAAELAELAEPSGLAACSPAAAPAARLAGAQHGGGDGGPAASSPVAVAAAAAAEPGSSSGSCGGGDADGTAAWAAADLLRSDLRAGGG